MRKLAIVVIVLAACSRRADRAAQDVALTRAMATGQLAEIEAAMASARARAANVDVSEAASRDAEAQRRRGQAACHAATSTLSVLSTRDDAELARKVDQLCRRDRPLAEVTAAVAAAEVDAKACQTFAAGIDEDLEALARLTPPEPRIDDVVSRYKARCAPR